MKPAGPAVFLLYLTLLGGVVSELFTVAAENGTTHHVTNVNNHSGNHENNSHGHNGGHGDHVGHHGIHVASWNYAAVKEPFEIVVFFLIAALCKLGFHHANFLSSILPESCALIVMGTVVGGIMYTVDKNADYLQKFTPNLFFIYLLPPIILESAYSLHDRVFSDNIGTIVLFAVVGTILNFLLIGVCMYGVAYWGWMGTIHIGLVECLLFSALIVAVDPVAVLAIFQEIGVNNTLYFLVFGESLLNDAVTVVLYNMMKTFNEMDHIPYTQVLLGLANFLCVSLGGLVIGIVFGIITAFLTKFTMNIRVIEPLTLLALAYGSYLMADMVHFSGIISIIGCGLVQAQYAFHNVSYKSQTTVTYFIKMLSAMCDCIIFLFLGLSLVRNHTWHTGFTLWAILFCLVIRFLVVFSLTFLVNRLQRLREINLEEQFIMAYGGLRGAVAFSLVAMLKDTMPHKEQFLTTTLVVIMFTVFLQGITIKPLVSLLRIKREEHKVSICEEINCHVTDHILAGIEEVIGQHGQHFHRWALDYVDDHYLKRWLQRDPQGKDDLIMDVYEKIALQQHYENLVGSNEAAERYCSMLDLYKPDTSADDDTARPPDLLAAGPDPEIVERTVDLMCRRRSSALPVAGKVKLNQEGASKPKEPQPTRRTSMFPFLGQQEEGLVENPTVNHVRKWLLNPTKQVYHQKYDPNLKNEERSDLLHHLYRKQLRSDRYFHHLGTSFGMSPTVTPESTPFGSTETFPKEYPGTRSQSLAFGRELPIFPGKRRRLQAHMKAQSFEDKAPAFKIDINIPDDLPPNTQTAAENRPKLYHRPSLEQVEEVDEGNTLKVGGLDTGRVPSPQPPRALRMPLQKGFTIAAPPIREESSDNGLESDSDSDHPLLTVHVGADDEPGSDTTKTSEKVPESLVISVPTGENVNDKDHSKSDPEPREGATADVESGNMVTSDTKSRVSPRRNKLVKNGHQSAIEIDDDVLGEV